MINAEETKRFKAKQLRYKKPIVKNLNLEYIKQDLWDIQEACEEVHWYTDSEDGEFLEQMTMTALLILLEEQNKII